MPIGKRIDYSVGLVAVSVLLFFVPVFDMWQDVTVGGKSLLSALFENSFFLVITVLFIAASVWLRRSDWEEEYIQIVARWSMLGTGAVGVLYGWILVFQFVFQNDLKPYIIAADGVVIGGIVLFVAGVYNARSKRESAALATERDRFSALFDNTPEAIAVIGYDGDTPVIEDVNAPFERSFDREKSDLRGRPVGTVLMDLTLEASSRDADGDADSSAVLVGDILGDPERQVEMHRRTSTGQQDFLVDYVPVGDESGSESRSSAFLVFTDITAQKERERRFETLSEGSERFLDSRSPDDIFGVVHELAVDLFDAPVVGVWTYDDEKEAFVPIDVATTARDGGTELPSISTVDPEDEATADVADDPPVVVDTERLTEAFADQGLSVTNALVRRLDARRLLIIGRTTSEFSTMDRYLADVLAGNARVAIERVDREAQLARRNDQLEFVNSLVRHDIQNTMTIIRSRGQALADSTTGQDSEYAETIVEQSDQIIDLVDRFRALLDALTDTDDASLESVSLSSVLDDRVASFETTHPETDVTAQIPPGVTVRADEMLTNVLGNVLRNAVEHNDAEQPTVEVDLTKRESVAVVRIADNGPGIPDEKKDVVFRRGNRGLKESDIGSGFGLFFVDAMMDRYDGAVTVEDNDPRGTVFELTFPIA